jgi:hypothetical protein
LLELFNEEVIEVEEDKGHRFILEAGKAGRIGSGKHD